MWRDVPKEPKQSSGNSHFKPEHPSQMGEGAGWGSAVLLLGRAVLVQLPGLGLCLPCSWELQFCAHMDNQQPQILRRSFCHQGCNPGTLCRGISLLISPAGAVGKLIPVPRRAPSEPLSPWPLGEQPVPVLAALRQEPRSHTPKEPLSLPFMSGACAAANR